MRDTTHVSKAGNPLKPHPNPKSLMTPNGGIPKPDNSHGTCPERPSGVRVNDGHSNQGLADVKKSWRKAMYKQFGTYSMTFLSSRGHEGSTACR